MTVFRECCNFYIKNKLKSEIFDDKESLQTKIFASVITIEFKLRNFNEELSYF